MEPYRAMDTCVAMGASIGVGLGLRHVLPEEQARRVVSIIGDSTFIHSGVSGIMEMAYNPPSSGHVVIVLDNGITAMTGQQEHPGTGRTLEHEATGKISIEGTTRAMGIETTVIDAFADPAGFERLLVESLAAPRLSVIVARRPCVLAAADIRGWEKAAEASRASASCAGCAVGDA
jgi:indolepyruvate ferredoxin oxidoreductase alpha subunit